MSITRGGRAPASVRPDPVVDLTAVPAADEISLLEAVEHRLTGSTGRQRWEKRYAAALAAADLTCVGLAVLPLLVVLARRTETTWWPVLLVPVLWLLLATLSRTYEPRRAARIDTQLRQTVDTGIRTVAVVLAAGLLTRWDPPHAVTLTSLALVLLLPATGRLAVRRVLHGLRRHGRWLHRVVAVGPAEEVRSFADETAARPEAGLVVVGGCTSEDVDHLEVRSGSLPVFGPPELAGTAARALAADGVAVLPQALARQKVRKLAWELEGTAIELLVAPALTDVAGPRISVRPMNAFALLHLEQPTFTGVRRIVKHTTDRLVAALALVLLSPLLLAITMLIRRDSPGRALFRQPRVGQCGETFTCFKLRTMYDDAEQRLIDLTDHNESGGTLFKIRSDPRITRIGAVLRRYSLDELPQLINVLRGEMSLVGPRPPLQREVDTYADDVRRRLLVRPGLTGLWQVSGRSDLSWEESVRLDLYYIENWSPLLDLTILWRTINAVRTARGAY